MTATAKSSGLPRAQNRPRKTTARARSRANSGSVQTTIAVPKKLRDTITATVPA
jgi:hypothetical protein